jgi:hypothetical protein
MVLHSSWQPRKYSPWMLFQFVRIVSHRGSTRSQVSTAGTFRAGLCKRGIVQQTVFVLCLMHQHDKDWSLDRSPTSFSLGLPTASRSCAPLPVRLSLSALSIGPQAAETPTSSGTRGRLGGTARWRLMQHTGSKPWAWKSLEGLLTCAQLNVKGSWGLSQSRITQFHPSFLPSSSH